MAQAADVDLDHILWAMPEWIEVGFMRLLADIPSQLIQQYMLPNRTITTPDEA